MNILADFIHVLTKVIHVRTDVNLDPYGLEISLHILTKLIHVRTDSTSHPNTLHSPPNEQAFGGGELVK